MERSKPKLVVGILLLVLGGGLLVWALIGRNAEAPSVTTGNTSQQQEEAIETETETANQAAVESAEIIFTSDGFTPRELTVKKGAIVTVKNNSNMNVQFSSDDHPTHRKQTEMNLKVLSPGESASFTISRVGTWGFHDHIDDSKVGTLTVTE